MPVNGMSGRGKHYIIALIADQCPHLCPSPIADHKVEWGGVLGVDEGAVEADRAPACVGHLGLVPEVRKFRCHAQYDGQILCHRVSITNYGIIITSPETQ